MIEQKLKDKIEAEKHLYDFKYIKRKFKSPTETDAGVYLSKEKMHSAVRDPTIQNSADKLLNLWQNYQFSFESNSFD